MGTAIVDMLPVLGSGIVFVPWIIYAFYQHNTYLAVGLIILFVVVILLKLILEPLVCGKKIGLSSAQAFLSVIVGFLLFGSSGLLLGPLLAVIIKIVLKHLGNNEVTQV